MNVEKWPLKKLLAGVIGVVIFLHALTLGLLWQQKRRLANVEGPIEQLKKWISVSDFASLQDYLSLLNDKVLNQEERLQGIVEQLDKRINTLQLALENIQTRLQKSAYPITAPNSIKASILKKYAVQKGDTLSTIAHKHHIQLENLRKHNNRVDPNKLYPGQILFIPSEP